MQLLAQQSDLVHKRRPLLVQGHLVRV